jgi:hypothetical protein
MRASAAPLSKLSRIVLSGHLLGRGADARLSAQFMSTSVPWHQVSKEHAEANCFSTASLPEAVREIQAASR